MDENFGALSETNERKSISAIVFWCLEFFVCLGKSPLIVDKVMCLLMNWNCWPEFLAKPVKCAKNSNACANNGIHRWAFVSFFLFQIPKHLDNIFILNKLLIFNKLFVFPPIPSSSKNL